MTRLPTVGGDSGNWGTVLNDFLDVSHNADGTLESGIVADTQVASGAAINPTKINGTAEVQTNKSTDGTMAADSDTLYPTQKAVKTYANTKSTVVLDTTASDIAPLGTQAAGSVGKAADAGHIHQLPRLDQVAAPTADVSLNNEKLTNVASPTNASDAANKQYVDMLLGLTIALG
jgi:hypothetical protein